MLRAALCTVVVGFGVLACQAKDTELFGSASSGDHEEQPSGLGEAGFGGEPENEGRAGSRASGGASNGSGGGSAGGTNGKAGGSSSPQAGAPGEAGTPGENPNDGDPNDGDPNDGDPGVSGGASASGGSGGGASCKGPRHGCGSSGSGSSGASGGSVSAGSGGVSAAAGSAGDSTEHGGAAGDSGATGGAAGDSGTSGAGGTAGSGGSAGGASQPPVFEESCAPALDPQPPPDCDYCPPYYAVVIDAARQLGPLTRNEAHGINNAGQVVGTWNPGSDLQDWRAWIWDAGTTVEITGPAGPVSWGDALNESGVVLGHLQNDGEYDSFLYAGGAPEVFDPDFSASGLNDRGDVVGGLPASGAAIWSGGELVNLQIAPGRYSTASAVNERREIAGSADFQGDGSRHAFVFACGTTRDLGTLGGSFSYAHDLNERGQIAGVSEDANGQQMVFSERAGVMTPLFSYDGERVAINEHGEVVSGDSLASNGRVFSLIELVAHDSCWLRFYANDINDHGDVAGWGRSCEDPGGFAPAVVITRNPERYRAYAAQ